MSNANLLFFPHPLLLISKQLRLLQFLHYSSPLFVTEIRHTMLEKEKNVYKQPIWIVRQFYRQRVFTEKQQKAVKWNANHLVNYMYEAGRMNRVTKEQLESVYSMSRFICWLKKNGLREETISVRKISIENNDIEQYTTKDFEEINQCYEQHTKESVTTMRISEAWYENERTRSFLE